MKKILITTGGTGGHVIPAKIIAEHLGDIFDIYFSTDLRGLKYLSSNKKRTIIFDTPKFNLDLFFPFKLLKIIFLIVKGVVLLKKEKFEKVISIGGDMSFPIVISAKILGLKIFLIEPNLVLGRANRFFLNFSKKILCYSNELSNFPQKELKKIEVIHPLVSKVFYDYKKNNNSDQKFCFLISGGSQGAQIFDELIKDVMIDISKNFPIKVIQQTSEKNIQYLQNFYNQKNVENKIFCFEENFVNLIDSANLCISRAGATSLAEISFLNKPFIAIPLPTAKDNHQMKNALYYEEMGYCWVLDQKNLNKEKLLNILISILKGKSNLNLKKSKFKKLNFNNSWKDANQKLKTIINEN